jgi:hypothetical protein|tara:strand:+ start:1463 stop:2239 length:777 start_codon:yes stop_codon:yes gene_type:complete
MRKEKICVIDADSLLYYIMGANSLEEAIEELDSRIIDILIKCKASKYVICLTESNCFRYDIATSRPYKGNRKKGDKPIIFYALRAHLKQHHVAYYHDRLEADDLVAFLAFKYATKYTVYICSPDKDVSGTVSGMHWNYSKKIMTSTTSKEAYKFLLMQTLTGDSTDNIGGIPGVGPAKAEKILSSPGSPLSGGKTLNAYVEEFGIAEGIYKFQENFRLVYLLRTDEDMLREIGLVPSMPIIQSINPKNKKDDPDYSEF